jgi:hypothetical protein
MELLRGPCGADAQAELQARPTLDTNERRPAAASSASASVRRMRRGPGAVLQRGGVRLAVRSYCTADGSSGSAPPRRTRTRPSGGPRWRATGPPAYAPPRARPAGPRTRGRATRRPPRAHSRAAGAPGRRSSRSRRRLRIGAPCTRRRPPHGGARSPRSAQRAGPRGVVEAPRRISRVRLSPAQHVAHGVGVVQLGRPSSRARRRRVRRRVPRRLQLGPEHGGVPGTRRSRACRSRAFGTREDTMDVAPNAHSTRSV